MSLALAGAAVSVGSAALTSILDHGGRMTVTLEDALQSAAQRHTLVRWLEGACMVPGEAGPEFRGVDAAYDQWPDDRLSFLTRAATPVSDGYTIVQLYIDRDPSTPERGLVAMLEEWRGSSHLRVELAPAAQGLEMRYLVREEETPQWIPGWISGNVLPGGVEIHLHASSPEALPLLLRRPALVALGRER